MLRCINLAEEAKGLVSPNPLVGSVIVKNGRIAAEGFHKKFGAEHAEINAINTALTKKIKLAGASIYINLEPCYHFGKTPPCVDQIIKHKFKKVIIGVKDPNPAVSGKSINKLRKNGIKVITRVLGSECRELNKFFFKYMQTGLPYITIKAAQTMDGRIARKNYDSKWITSFESRMIVHKLRSEYDAVLVGRKTVKYDDPELTVRHVKGRNPFRIVIDKSLALSLNFKLFKDEFADKTIILTGKIKNKHKASLLYEKGITVIECSERNRKIILKDAMKKLAENGIISILVEGGADTFNNFLNEGLADEAQIFISPKIFGEGIPTFKDKMNFSGGLKSVEKTGEDILLKFILKEY